MSCYTTRAIATSVCLEGVGLLWQNDSLDLDAVWAGEWSRSRDGCIGWDGDRRRGSGSFGGKYGASHCGVVILCRGGCDATVPKLL